MSLADAIYAQLKTRPVITGIVGDNIFHFATEQQNPLAAVFFEEVSEVQVRAFCASPVLASTRMAFECWFADTQDVNGQQMAEAIGHEVYMAFCDPNGDKSGPLTGNVAGTYIQDVRFDSSRPLYDEQARKWGREIDLTFDCRL